MNAAVTIRRYAPADLDAVLGVFRASIEGLAAEHYNSEQRAAWMAAADDACAFGKMLEKQSVLLAVMDGEAVGVASRAGGLLDVLYVAPQAARAGVASKLCDALESEAVEAGFNEMRTEASDAARAFFARRGYAAAKRNVHVRKGVQLENTTMIKRLDVEVPA